VLVAGALPVNTQKAEFNRHSKGRRVALMLLVSGLVMGIITLIFGVVVMIFPKILNYLIGIYLIIIGIWAIIQAMT
jgi:uncharacterized membrane protein HdeD (DUF308 family)